MEIKYDGFDDQFEKCITNDEERELSRTWMLEDTLDKWRHRRMLDLIKPLIEPNETWLTIGDGRYGTDANFIRTNGGNAHATDLSVKLLRIGKELDYIDSFSCQNAERLDFEDESFDYVLIKEALHHLPRPWIGLHEAFRVCRKSVVIIEPSDEFSLFKYIRKIAKLSLGRPTSPYFFENVGNFVYCLNSRELEKFMLGMHYTEIAFNNIHDSHKPGIEFVKMSNPSVKEKMSILRLKIDILIQSTLWRVGLHNGGLIASILFKEKPSELALKKLARRKWKHKILPKNPFIS